jgi:transposase
MSSSARDAKHLVRWAGLCPGNAESPGKRFSGRTRNGDRYLRRILVQNAWAGRTYEGLRVDGAVLSGGGTCRDGKKAAVAVAHRILTLAYYIIRDGAVYRETGGDVYDRRDAAARPSGWNGSA